MCGALATLGAAGGCVLACARPAAAATRHARQGGGTLAEGRGSRSAYKSCRQVGAERDCFEQGLGSGDAASWGSQHSVVGDGCTGTGRWASQKTAHGLLCESSGGARARSGGSLRWRFTPSVSGRGSTRKAGGAVDMQTWHKGLRHGSSVVQLLSHQSLQWRSGA